jgi:choline dehydrogenase
VEYRKGRKLHKYYAGGSSAAAGRSTRRNCFSFPGSAIRSTLSKGFPWSRDLPGVGENLQDHLEVYIQCASKRPVSLYPGAQALEHAQNRSGMAVLTHGHWRQQPF